MIEIFDEYCWEEHKKVITYNQHKIKGLRNFAYWNLSNATPPTPMHHHSDIVELHCLIKGKRVCVVNDVTYTVTGNELFMTFPFEPHNNGSYHLSPCSFYGFQIDLKEKENFLGLNKVYSLALHKILTNHSYRHLRFNVIDMQLLKMAFENISDGNPEAFQLGVQYLSCFLFKISEFVPVRFEQKINMDHNIKRVLEYIDEHFRENHHLQELAVLSGYSLSRLKIKFKDEVGIPPANFIILKKIEYAKYLLRTTDKPITLIALDSGFSSSNYFCSVLRKMTNYTPSEYRRISNERKMMKQSNKEILPIRQ